MQIKLFRFKSRKENDSPVPPPPSPLVWFEVRAAASSSYHFYPHAHAQVEIVIFLLTLFARSDECRVLFCRILNFTHLVSMRLQKIKLFTPFPHHHLQLECVRQFNVHARPNRKYNIFRTIRAQEWEEKNRSNFIFYSTERMRARGKCAYARRFSASSHLLVIIVDRHHPTAANNNTHA